MSEKKLEISVKVSMIPHFLADDQLSSTREKEQTSFIFFPVVVVPFQIHFISRSQVLNGKK